MEEWPSSSQLEDAYAQIALAAFMVYSGNFDSIKNDNASQFSHLNVSL